MRRRKNLRIFKDVLWCYLYIYIWRIYAFETFRKHLSRWFYQNKLRQDQTIGYIKAIYNYLYWGSIYQYWYCYRYISLDHVLISTRPILAEFNNVKMCLQERFKFSFVAWKNALITLKKCIWRDVLKIIHFW